MFIIEQLRRVDWFHVTNIGNIDFSQIFLEILESVRSLNNAWLKQLSEPWLIRHFI